MFKKKKKSFDKAAAHSSVHALPGIKQQADRFSDVLVIIAKNFTPKESNMHLRHEWHTNLSSTQTLHWNLIL